MAGISDNAVGAILEIPDDLLTKIRTAEGNIRSLGETSERVAKEISNHWGTIATSGLDAFIRKLQEATGVMSAVSGKPIDININTQPLENKLNDVSNASKKTADDVSKTVQTLAWDTLDFTNMERLRESLMGLNTSYEQLEATIKSMQNTRSKQHPDDTMGLSQEITNKIELLKEYIALKKKSEEQLKSKVTDADKNILDEQKRLLAEQLDLRRQINAQKKIVASGEITGSAKLNEERAILQQLYEQYRKNSTELRAIKKEKGDMSDTGRDKFDLANERQKNTLLELQIKYRQDLNKELTRAAELTAQTQVGKARLGNTEEAAVQRQLNSDYKQMLGVIKEIGEVKAKAAEQGRGLNQQEINLIATLGQRYRMYHDDIQRVSGAYSKMSEAAAKNFQADKSEQFARNAVMLADAQQKAAGNTSHLVAEYKRLYAENEKLYASMKKYYNEAGGTPSTAATGTRQVDVAYREIEARHAEVLRQMRDLESKNIQEIADFRMQKNMEANQRSISEFVQAEAQKTAEAKKQAEQQSNDRIQAYQRFLNTYQGAMAAANKLGTRGGQWEDTYENRARVIKNLEAAIKSLNKADADYESKLKDLTDALKRLKDAQKEVDDVMKQKPQVTLADANQARKIAEQTKTLKDYETAYKLLIEVMKQTPQGRAWDAMNAKAKELKHNIDEIKKKMGEFQSQASKTSGLMGQLQGRIAAAFSAAAISGFIKKMVEVRAQFELQRVALGAIIQDRDEANKIFTQVQNMALESPFNIMQLEKATKQIAAFGFETKKLVPTMKMFADISAGLGVEIDRLVLVMGHLKARNFLEGTMVRQFTNMGFNVLGELSKYYSELENKMVSVGEVQDRVKKKMVSFEDVEEVLKRVTSAGGMFYDMQKKQSESLWGQMQRIKDAYDLMLNEIGQSNEGTLKSALTFIRTLINHWRTLAPIIQATGAAIAVYFAVSRFSAIAAGVAGVVQAFKNMTTVIWGTKAAQDALNASQKANAWGLLASLIIAATVAIYEYATAQSQLNESMDRVRNEGIGNMYDLIYQYQKLADTVRDTNKPYEEQKKALDEIKRIYADILPAELLEIKNIKEMSDGYERATEAIKAYSAEKIKSNLKAEIENIVGKEIQSEGNDLADWFAVFAEKWDLLPEKMPVDTFRSMVKTMIAEISEEVKNGEMPVDSAFDELKKHMQDRLKNLMPKDALDQLFERIESRNKGWGETYFEDWEESLQKFQDQINGIDIGFEGAESERLVVAKNQYEDLTKAVDEYKKAIEALRIAKENGKVEGDVSQDANGNFTAKNDGQEGQKALDNLSQAYKKLQGQVEEYGVTWTTTSKDINAAIESQTGQMNYFEQTNEKVFIRVLSGFSRWQKEYREDDSVKAWVERTLREADKLDLSSVQNKILDVALSVTSANGMQTKSLDKLRLASLNSFGDAAKAAQSVYNQLAQNEIAIQTQIKSLVRYGYSAAQAKMMAEEQYGAGLTVEEIKEMMELYKELIPAFGGTFKDPNKSKSKSDKELKRWQDLKKAIEDVTTAYDKYRKSFSVEESNKRIEELYAPAFKELNTDIKQFYKDGKYDTEAMIKALEELKGLTNATTEERKKFRSEIERKIGVSQVEIEVKMSEDAERKLKSDLDEMFANYELTKELKGLGVPVELMFMLGGKPTDLDKLKKQLQTEFEAIGGKAAPENVVKAYEDSFKKIADLENKQRQQQLKNYIKYLTESMGERAQIEIKALQDINKIENDATLDAFSMQQAIMQRRKKMQEELTKFDLDELKSSDVYISVFKDLETASKEQLQYVIDKLKETQTAFSDLSPAQVKSIANDLKKLESALASKDSVRNLFSNLKTSIEYAKKRNDLLKEQTQTQEDVNDSTKELSDAQVRLTNLQLKLKSIQDESSDEWKEANAAVEAQQRLVKELQDKIAELEEKLKKLTGEIEDGESAWEGWRKGINNIRNGMNQVKDSLDAVFAGLDSMGLVNDTFRDTYESIGDIVGGLGTFMDGIGSIDITKPFSIITGSIKAIGGIAQTIGAAFGIGDKKKEREIQRLTEKVETLDKAYQKLEKSIEAAYTFSDYNAGFKKMQQSLDAQKQAYEEMKALEEAKKKTDKDKVKEYNDALEEIAEKEKELRDQMIEDMGSTTDYRGAAEDFVSAWLDAYKETGDGLDALGDKWDEFIQNMFIKQAAMARAGVVYKNVIDIFNNALNEGKRGEALQYAIDEAEKAAADANEYMNMYLKGLADIFHIKPGGAGNLILSDLQKGIQNITEPQAAAIEAYLNSMRFAVFHHTEQLDTLIAAIQMQYGSGAENPVVTELKGIRSVLDSINSKFDSIIGKNGFQSAIRIVS